ncbi:hypothetical protein BDR26DRAFT_860405 [Obelidium mucronatum]|nr:hypothetical protein BDR26DRAFT_860405 [Obelidium mucronatum]
MPPSNLPAIDYTRRLRKLAVAAGLSGVSVGCIVAVFAIRSLSFVTVTSSASSAVGVSSFSLSLLGPCVSSVGTVKCTSLPNGLSEPHYSLSTSLQLNSNPSTLGGKLNQQPELLLKLLPYTVNTAALLACISSLFFGVTGGFAVGASMYSLDRPDALQPLSLMALVLTVLATICQLTALCTAIIGSSALNNLITDTVSVYGLGTQISVGGPVVIAIAFLLNLPAVWLIANVFISLRNISSTEEDWETRLQSVSIDKPKSVKTSSDTVDSRTAAKEVATNNSLEEHPANVATRNRRLDQAAAGLQVDLDFEKIRPVEGLRTVEDPVFQVSRIKSLTGSIVNPPEPHIQVLSPMSPLFANSALLQQKPPSALLAAAQPTEVRAALVKEWERKNSKASSPVAQSSTDSDTRIQMSPPTSSETIQTKIPLALDHIVVMSMQYLEAPKK